jgi:hypothetical protein
MVKIKLVITVYTMQLGKADVFDAVAENVDKCGERDWHLEQHGAHRDTDDGRNGGQAKVGQRRPRSGSSGTCNGSGTVVEREERQIMIYSKLERTYALVAALALLRRDATTYT